MFQNRIKVNSLKLWRIHYLSFFQISYSQPNLPLTNDPKGVRSIPLNENSRVISKKISKWNIICEKESGFALYIERVKSLGIKKVLGKNDL